MIRLLNVHSLSFREFYEDSAPTYAIASHRWGEDEATFKDVLKSRKQDSAGFKKIRGFCNLLKSWKSEFFVDEIDWLWIDTCCIDKKSSAELSEAINSMYGWYADAEICIAYLSDVGIQQESHDLESSEWFKRGWTLQELIAPPIVLLTDCEWNAIGHKEGIRHGIPLDTVQHILGPQRNERISRRTKISEDVLFDHDKLYEVSYEERLSWMDQRQTTRVEDEAYCLLGIFDVYMPLIYGERQQATRRLLSEILRMQSAMIRNHEKPTGTEQVAASSDVENTERLEDALLQTVRKLQNRVARLEAEQTRSRSQQSAPKRNRQSANVRMLSSMLDQYQALQLELSMGQLELEKAMAFWNPLECTLDEFENRRNFAELVSSSEF